MKPAATLGAGRVARAVLASAFALLLGACSTAHYPVNEPLARSRADDGYATRNLHSTDNSDSLSVMMAFSGGGYRAAAMAYAALEVLRDAEIVWEGERRSVLQELDIVSAVSGGSLAAAYYARDPTGFFDEFRSRVLDFDLQSALVSRALSPRGLWRQSSPTFGRGDLLQELLDEHVFGGRTFGDLPRRRPMVYLNATDMRFGDRFEFSQDQFDHLCSDLDRLPVARAVAASMAVPIVLSPITLWNHRGRCPVDLHALPVHGRSASSAYIHLVDGGLADNTGVRAAIETVAARGGIARTTQLAGFRGVKVRVFIVVNAQVDPRDANDDSPNTPGLLRQLRSAVDVPIDRYSASSLQALAAAVQQWQTDLRVASISQEGEGTFARDARIHLIEIGVASAQDPIAAEVVRNIPTSLRIDAEQVEIIRRFVRNEFAANPTWQQLLGHLRSQEPALKSASVRDSFGSGAP